MEGHFDPIQQATFATRQAKLQALQYLNTSAFSHDQGPGSAQHFFVPARRDNCVCRKEKASLSHRLDSHKPDSHTGSHTDSHMPDSHRPEEDGPVTLCKIQCNYYAGYALVTAPRPGILDRLN